MCDFRWPNQSEFQDPAMEFRGSRNLSVLGGRCFSPMDVNEKQVLSESAGSHKGVIFRVSLLEKAERKDQEKSGPW